MDLSFQHSKVFTNCSLPKKTKVKLLTTKKNSPLSPRIIIIFDNSALFPTSTSVGSRTGAVLCIHHLVILESNILSLRYIVFMPMNNGCILIASIFKRLYNLPILTHNPYMLIHCFSDYPPLSQHKPLT